MASPQHPATIMNFPEDLLLNIFTRLFSKQLAQMRSVSKSWNALLSNPSFVKSHLHRSIHRNDQILLVIYHWLCPSDSKPLTAHPSQSPHLKLAEFNKLPQVNPESEDNNSIRVIGVVNSLICSSYNCDSVIHIWNPSLYAVLTLPPYLLPSPRPSEINLRFGFDPKTDDYKFIKITGIPITQQPSAQGTNHFLLHTTIKEWLQVEVYSMRKGSWQVISARLPFHITMIFDTSRLCADGHADNLNWSGNYDIGGKTYSKTIVSFDLGSHTFSEIPPHILLC